VKPTGESGAKLQRARDAIDAPGVGGVVFADGALTRLPVTNALPILCILRENSARLIVVISPLIED